MFVKIKNYIKENTGILIRLDDIAENMNWDLMEKSESLFEKYEIKPVLGVIPNNKDKELLSYPKADNFWQDLKNHFPNAFFLACFLILLKKESFQLLLLYL